MAQTIEQKFLIKQNAQVWKLFCLIKTCLIKLYIYTI